MRWPYMRRVAPEICATARAQRWDPAEVLRVLIVEEGVIDFPINYFRQ